jgi:hypothetical protein
MRYRWLCVVVPGVLAGGAAQAWDFAAGEVSGSLKSSLSYGVAVRTEAADARLIGKLDLNPGTCGPSDCISFSGDASQNQKLVRAPGAYLGVDKDHGDLDYSRWGVVAALSRLSEDLSLNWGDFGLRLGGFYYYDAANAHKDERHPDDSFQPATTSQPPEIRRQLGHDLALREAVLDGRFTLLGHDFSAAAGYQAIHWGESTYVALNSLNQINPPSQVLLHQPGTPVSDVFRPTPALRLSTHLTEALSLDLVYELGWVPAETDPDGAFYSAWNFFGARYFMLGPGQFHDDPQGQARLPPPGNEISDSSATAPMLDRKHGYPHALDQAGLRLNWYAENLNGGTALSFYALNYHSQLPYLSVIATAESCMRDAQGFVDAFFLCNGFVGLNPATGKEPLPMDTLQVFVDYPQNIQMLGLSFNTTLGRWSLAGEYSIRPDLPLQVAGVDLIYAGLQPSFPRRDINLGLDPATLQQTIASLGSIAGQFASGDPAQLFQDGATFLTNLPTVVGVTAQGVTIPASHTFFPDYLEAYRGTAVQPRQLVRGYQRFVVDQLDLTALRALGRSENPLGANQVLLIGELGFTHVWNLPARSRLQLEGGDANDTHASPGADGSGNGGTPDTRRDNPTQQTHGFASAFAWGYRLSAQLDYDAALWGLSFKPSLTWGQDVSGIAPVPIQNFVAGTKFYVLGSAVEYGSHWTGQLYYQGSTGGGTVNSQRDRDTLGLNLSYSF